MLNHVDICGLPGQFKVKVNNVEVPCKDIEYHQSAGEVPKVKIEIPINQVVSDLFCQTFFKFDEESIRTANVILRNELLKKGEYYNGFLTSIESILKDREVGTNIHELSVDIIDRIIGDIE